MPTSRSRFVASALALAAAGLLAACGSSSSSSSSAKSSSSAPGAGDKTAFCRDNGDLDAETLKISGPADLAQVFKDNNTKLDNLLRNAPSEVKADTQALVSAAKQVASTGDPSPFTMDPKLQAAGQHLDTFCGVSLPTRSSDTTSGSTSSSSTTESSSVNSTYEYSSSS